MRASRLLRAGLVILAGCSFFVDATGLSERTSPAAGADGAVGGDGPSSPDADPAPPDAAVATGYAGAVLADGPVAYYRLAEQAGPALADVLGKTPGTYFGTVELGVPGALADGDTAVRFVDGGGANLGDVFDFAGLVPFSVELWMAPEKDDYYRFAIGKRATLPMNGYGIFVHQGQLCGEYVNADDYRPTCTPITLGGYAHVVWTYDRATCRLYVNGTERAQVDCAAKALPDTQAGLLIGKERLTLTSSFEGRVDEVALYEKVLTADRVLAHYEAAKR